jgi:hypothetical protein
MREDVALSICSRTHSAAARVFPDPRPPKISQVRHVVGGGNWLSRA